MKKFVISMTMILMVFISSVVMSAEIRINRNITSNEYWTSNNVYILDKLVYVEPGATLFIEAGTVIKGAAGQESNAKALIVSRGAKIYAEGTAEEPIIFTAEADDPTNPFDMDSKAVGQWGGVVLLGNARTNAPGGEAYFEGIDPSPLTLYGGPDDNDCSGVLRYVSIRHGGTQIGAGKEINGLSMAGVGKGTVISFVEVYANKDDAFEWWGGNVRCDHLVAAFSQDDAIDFDEGNRSKLQYVFVIQDANGDKDDTRLGEHDGCHKNNIGGEPNAYPIIYNATYLGAGKDGHEANYIFRLRENWAGVYKNSIFGDFNGKAVRIDNTTSPDSYDRLMAGDLVFTNNIWFDISAGSDWASITNADYTANYFSDPTTKNDLLTDFSLTGISRSFNSKGLDPRPAAHGQAYQDLADLPEDDDFFEYAPYKGAFGATNWLKGWTALDHYGILGSGTSVREFDKATKLPHNFSLEQNYPNPFNPSTMIEFSLPVNSKVKLSVYNIMGEMVATLLNDNLTVGTHRIQWNAKNFPTGMYVYRLEAGSIVMNKKLMLLK
ncbi:MAG: T9SS type A sorting domain-containing protein [bacterium]|nr:T9SS type A sorting domain-containing protein [bacterium]